MLQRISTKVTVNARGLGNAIAKISLIVIVGLFGGCGGGGGETGIAMATITSVAVTPTDESLVVGQAHQFKATATYSDGSTKDVSSAARWYSSHTQFATVSSIGIVDATWAGQTTISISLSGVVGSTPLTVKAKALTSISVEPAGATLAIGLSQQFSAIGSYNDGSLANITRSVIWISSSPSTATVGSSGSVTTVAQGTTSIIATGGAIQGSAVLTVPNASRGTWESPLLRIPNRLISIEWEGRKK